MSLLFRSIHPEVFCEKGVLKKFAKCTGKACNFIKKRLWHRCYPKNFAKSLRTAFFIEHLRVSTFDHWLQLDLLNLVAAIQLLLLCLERIFRSV